MSLYYHCLHFCGVFNFYDLRQEQDVHQHCHNQAKPARLLHFDSMQILQFLLVILHQVSLDLSSLILMANTDLIHYNFNLQRASFAKILTQNSNCHRSVQNLILHSLPGYCKIHYNYMIH